MSKDIISRMVRAGVPRSCWQVSATKTGRLPLRDFAAATLNRMESREAVACAYLRNPDFDARVLSAELMAKEFVLLGSATRYITFNKLTRDLRTTPDDTYENSVNRVYAKGAIVVPDLPTLDDVDASRVAEYHETLEFLMGHTYEGGVLVVAGAAGVSKNYRSKWPKLFERLLLTGAEVIEGV